MHLHMGHFILSVFQKDGDWATAPGSHGKIGSSLLPSSEHRTQDWLLLTRRHRPPEPCGWLTVCHFSTWIWWGAERRSYKAEKHRALDQGKSQENKLGLARDNTRWRMHLSEQGEGRAVTVNRGHTECPVLGHLRLPAQGPVYKEKAEAEPPEAEPASPSHCPLLTRCGGRGSQKLPRNWV